MDNVKLLRKHMKSIKLLAQDDGEWVDGEWVEGSSQDVTFEGALFPLKPNDFKNYPEGLLRHDDRKIITKFVLKPNDKIVIDNKSYIIITIQDYSYLADVNFYIIRLSKEVGENA